MWAHLQREGIPVAKSTSDAGHPAVESGQEVDHISTNQCAQGLSSLAVTQSAGSNDLMHVEVCQQKSQRKPCSTSASEPWIDGLGLKCEDGEDRLVHIPEGLVVGERCQCFQAETMLASGELALLAEALA